MALNAAQHTASAAKQASFVLPMQVLTHADVSRLVREAEAIEAFFEEASLKGADPKTVPQASQQLMALLSDNNLNILHKEERLKLVTFLHAIHKKAPLVHLSFATDPKPDFLMKLVTWFRSNAHPYVLLQVGLQPNIAAGCILRTTNKYFDFSFKEHFQESKAKLALALRESK